MAGIPVVTSNLFEMKRLVEFEEVGLVAEYNNIQGFQDAIKKIICLPYENMANKVLSTREKYSWEAQEKTLKKVYHGI